MKRVPILGDTYREIEANVMAAICQRFGLATKRPQSVIDADNTLLATEKHQFFNGTFGDKSHFADESYKPVDMTFVPLLPPEAKLGFLRRFRELYQGD